MKKTLILIILLAVVLGAAFAAGRFTTPVKVETVEIPGEIVEVMVPVTVTETIETPGPERIVERIVWKTKVVPVEKEVIRNICPGGDPEEDYEPEAFVAVMADKFHGLVDDELRQGWVGSAECQVRRHSGAVWATLASAPIDLTESVAQSTVDPRDVDRVLRGRLEIRAGLTSRPGATMGASWYRVGRRWGLWAQVDYDLDPAQDFSFGNGYATDASWAVSGGVSRRFGRK